MTTSGAPQLHSDGGANDTLAMAFDDTPVPMHRLAAVSSKIKTDPLTLSAVEPFDFTWDGTTTFEPWAVPDLPSDFHLGVIVGTSGSGKSTMLRALGDPSPPPLWDMSKSIAAHFDSADDATARLTAVGLSSVPLWCKPYGVLSNGERFRADLARSIDTGALLDEFSSVVDRHVAKAASFGLARYIRKQDIRGVVLATCHRDVLAWLEPDWYVDTDSGEYVVKPRECLQRPSMVVEIRRATRAAWDHFVGHHYLSTTLHPFARCYIASWDDVIVGFAASIPFPHGHIKQAWRETRTVVLPEFQGLGLGTKISDHVAAMHAGEGLRYFSRTQHPRMGEYRERHPELWRPTSSNRKKATPPKREDKWSHWQFDGARVAYSHEWVGPAGAPDPISAARRKEREDSGTVWKSNRKPIQDQEIA